LLTGLERQRFCELKGNPVEKLMDLVDAAYPTRASEICHLERRIQPEARDTEMGYYALAAIRTTVVDVEAKRRAPAGDVKHLTL
jgi:hypothetical protein